MRRINFDLIRAEEELAGARQCIVLVSLKATLHLMAALAYYLDAMTLFWAWVWLISTVSLGSAAAIFCWLPTLKERRFERDRLTSDNGSYVDPA